VTHALNAANQAPHWSVALVGNPNCGKTALFNLLTGARQKVANYAGVTVERKVGLTRLKNGRTVSVIDLPGSYSLTPATPDEQITLEVIEGRRHGEAAPDAIVAVVDATNLRMNLRLVLELAQLGRPLMVALNMADVARAEGLKIDVDKLAAELGCPVVETVAVRADGHAQLLALLGRTSGTKRPRPRPTARPGPVRAPKATRAKRPRRPTCSSRFAASSPSPRRAHRRCAASSTASTPS
jgi:ferrous iron transport protein B